jgi:hypothetical protein
MSLATSAVLRENQPLAGLKVRLSPLLVDRARIGVKRQSRVSTSSFLAYSVRVLGPDGIPQIKPTVSYSHASWLPADDLQTSMW